MKSSTICNKQKGKQVNIRPQAQENLFMACKKLCLKKYQSAFPYGIIMEERRSDYVQALSSCE